MFQTEVATRRRGELFRQAVHPADGAGGNGAEEDEAGGDEAGGDEAGGEEDEGAPSFEEGNSIIAIFFFITPS